MDTEPMEEASKLSRDHREELHSLRKKVNRYLKDRESYSRCEVEVKRRGDWYEFHGHVSASSTKAVLFGMVPKRNGAQRIVDYLRVGSLAG